MFCLIKKQICAQHTLHWQEGLIMSRRSNSKRSSSSGAKRRWVYFMIKKMSKKAQCMAECCPESLRFLQERQYTIGFALVAELNALDAAGVYGAEIYRLWNVCCHADEYLYQSVLSIFSHNQMTYNEIHSRIQQGKEF